MHDGPSNAELRSDEHRRGTVSENDLARIYADLRRYAQTLLIDERLGHTLQATALVHEGLGKLLAEQGEPLAGLPPEDDLGARRRALFGMISRRMRQVLVEHARHRDALKGPGRRARSPLHEAMASIDRRGIDLLALEESLGKLQAVDSEAALVFEHHWFGGLSLDQVSRVLEVTPMEAHRRWTSARRILQGLVDPPR